MLEQLSNNLPEVKGQNHKKTALIKKSVSHFSINLAFAVDFVILAIPRLITLITIVAIAEPYRYKLLQEIIEKNGAVENFNLALSQNKILLFNSTYIKIILASLVITIFIGMIYHVIMLTSSWGASIGQRINKLHVVRRKTAKNLTVIDAISRVILSYIVWIFPVLVWYFWSINKLLSLLFIMLISVWGDMSFVFGSRFSVQDILTGTVLIAGRNDNIKFKFFVD